MTVKEILVIESANTGSINLFKEGIFWRVYQKSAYFFTKQIKDLKVLKKFYKNVNCEVVYAGFPDTILPQIEALSQSKEFKFENHNEKHCSISGVEIDNDFEQWFQSHTRHTELVEVQKTKGCDKVYPRSADGSASAEYSVVNEDAVQYAKRNIIRQIKEYPVISKTPIEAFNFLADIQKQLYEL